MAEPMALAEIVNTGIYPIDDRRDARRTSLIEKCRKDLATNLYCLIPNFVTDTALRAMREEALRLQALTHHNNAVRNCYLHRGIDSSRPLDHARNLRD